MLVFCVFSSYVVDLYERSNRVVSPVMPSLQNLGRNGRKVHRGVSRQKEREPFERRSKSRAAAVVRERARGASEAKPSSSACSVVLPGMVRRMGFIQTPFGFRRRDQPLAEAVIDPSCHVRVRTSGDCNPVEFRPAFSSSP